MISSGDIVYHGFQKTAMKKNKKRGEYGGYFYTSSIEFAHHFNSRAYKYQVFFSSPVFYNDFRKSLSGIEFIGWSKAKNIIIPKHDLYYERNHEFWEWWSMFYEVFYEKYDSILSVECGYDIVAVKDLKQVKFIINRNKTD
jgi:hypothetical protein